MLTDREIWECGRKMELTVQATRPRVELPDGTMQGFSCFRAFSTTILDDEGQELG